MAAKNVCACGAGIRPGLSECAGCEQDSNTNTRTTYTSPDGSVRSTNVVSGNASVDEQVGFSW